MFRAILVVIFFAALILSPAQAQEAVEANLTDACVETFDASVDYFPDKATVEYAANFQVEYFNHYKVVSVVPWPGAEAPATYILLQCGAPAPEGFEGVPVIEVPVGRFVGMTTSILPHLTDQGLLDRLVGVDTALFTSNEAVLERVASGDIVEIGGGGSGGEINFEILLSAEPDLVMAQEFFAGETTVAQLTETGVPAVLNADYADTTPLGQAEWGKFVALFFNTEAQAAATFDGVVERYDALKALTAELEARPTTIAAGPYAGTWYMPGGDSTVAQLLADAGADFLFADMPGTSNPLDFEVVLEQGADAAFWVNANMFWATTDAMLADDPRFASFQAYENGSIWNNNRRMNVNGGSDYFETGAAHPDLILADLIAIFHPDLLPDHEFTFYQRLEPAG
ncbi:MAG: ABC transporter substrate-binding protein [Anaerolineae bacterium]|nr:ABC transporter substrate-binding protein [Anaerolineae bacterium]